MDVKGICWGWRLVALLVLELSLPNALNAIAAHAAMILPPLEVGLPSQVQGREGRFVDACLGFGAAEAASVLELSVSSSLRVHTEEKGGGLRVCSFRGESLEKSVSFSVSVSPDERTAIKEMESYRENLELAATTAPHRENLRSGAYSEISDIGDENVWTDINGTLSVRKGAITFQIQQPPGKLKQIRVAQAILSKL